MSFKRSLFLGFTWPVRRWRVAAGRCPWCNEELLQALLQGGPLDHRLGHVSYCARYHYFSSVCKYRQRVFDMASTHSNEDAYTVRIQLHDPKGNLPQEAREVIDALVYALHRVVLYERIDQIDMAYYKEQATQAALRSSERLLDRLLMLDGGRN
jgi:hypothetical protein